MKSLFVNGKPAPDSASKVCLLYDPKDGRVVHVHGATWVEGGREVSDAELEERAKTHAGALGRSVAGLKPLHVPVSAVRLGGPLKVNAEGTALVPFPQAGVRTRELLAERRAAKTGPKS